VIAIMGMDRSGIRGRVLPTLLKLAVLACAGLALLALIFVAFVIVLPLMVAAGVGLTLFLRRRLRWARRRPDPADGIIDAEYKIVESRPLERP
jgi:hypothetical protein